MVGVATLKYRTTNSESGTKNFPNVNPNYLPKWDATTATSDTAKIKTAVQALNALTTNTFSGVSLTMTEDISSLSENVVYENV